MKIVPFEESGLSMMCDAGGLLPDDQHDEIVPGPHKKGNRGSNLSIWPFPTACKEAQRAAPFWGSNATTIFWCSQYN
jgi:hypothetical protein